MFFFVKKKKLCENRINQFKTCFSRVLFFFFFFEQNGSQPNIKKNTSNLKKKKNLFLHPSPTKNNKSKVIALFVDWYI